MTAGTLRLRFLRKALTINASPPTLLAEHELIESIATYGKHFAALAQGASSNDQ